jgi:hypothetical protein
MEKVLVTSKEWDQFLMTLGKLAFAMGSLEMTLIGMHCRITGKTEAELGLEHGFQHRQALEKKVETLSWTAAEKSDFINRLGEVRALAKRRNPFIHVAAGIVSDNSIPGILVWLEVWSIFVPTASALLAGTADQEISVISQRKSTWTK